MGGNPVFLGRNRESRSREAAGRRNWPEAVPKKMRGRKRALIKSVRMGIRSRLRAKQLAQTTRNARRPSDRPATPAVPEHTTRTKPLRLAEAPRQQTELGPRSSRDRPTRP